MLLETSGPTPSMLRGTDTKRRSAHPLALASRYISLVSRTRASRCASAEGRTTALSLCHVHTTHRAAPGRCFLPVRARSMHAPLACCYMYAPSFHAAGKDACSHW